MYWESWENFCEQKVSQTLSKNFYWVTRPKQRVTKTKKIMTRLFTIEKTPLDVVILSSCLQNFSAGALVTFEGRVRNHNAGKEVSALEYEAHVSLAEKEGQKILEEALLKFDILEAICVHRIGKLLLGEGAVWVGVISKHRKEAFRACEYIIDTVKHTLPIWKKEHYKDGEAVWVHCAACTQMDQRDHSV